MQWMQELLPEDCFIYWINRKIALLRFQHAIIHEMIILVSKWVSRFQSFTNTLQVI